MHTFSLYHGNVDKSEQQHANVCIVTMVNIEKNVFIITMATFVNQVIKHYGNRYTVTMVKHVNREISMHIIHRFHDEYSESSKHNACAFIISVVIVVNKVSSIYTCCCGCICESCESGMHD